MSMHGSGLLHSSSKIAEKLVVDSPEGEDEAPLISNWQMVVLLKHINTLAFLASCQGYILGPSILYLYNSFWVPEEYGEVDCEVDPGSQACKQGATLASFFFATTGLITLTPQFLSSIYISGWSDNIGRLPILRWNTIASILPVVAIVLYQWGPKISLWVFIALSEAFVIFDVLPVYAAHMLDLITHKQDRARGYAIQSAVGLVIQAVVSPTAGFITLTQALVISLIFAVLKTMYMLLVFPETRDLTNASDERMSLCGLLFGIKEIMTKRRYFIRMMLVLSLSGLNTAGVYFCIAPFMTGWVGMFKGEYAIFSVLFLFSSILWLVACLGPMIYCFGEVRALRVCILLTVAAPLLFWSCQVPWHAYIVVALLGGPFSMQFALIAALTSNIAEEKEQGLVQGMLGATRLIVTSLSSFLFAVVWNAATDNGKGDKASTFWPWACISIAAFVTAMGTCALPNQVELKAQAKQTFAEIMLELRAPMRAK